MSTTFDDWLRAMAATGKGGGYFTPAIDRGGPYTLVITFPADFSADAFAASLRLAPDASGASLADFAVAVGLYADGYTPLTLTLTQAQVDALPADDDADGIVTLAMDILRTPSGGAQTRLMGGAIQILGEVTDYA